jgi:DNA-binding CsgD family transcriptional regulator
VGFAVPGQATGIAGRSKEQAALRTAVTEASEGRPCSVLVHGEAGVGKTSLVAATCRRAAADGFQVLWGRAMSFGAGSAPYLPIVGAFETWLADAEDAERALLVERVPEIADLIPSLGGSGAPEPGRFLTVVDRALAVLAEHRPLVLVIDDLQWADVTSRDALAYLFSGLRRQRLAVLGTYRDDGLADGDPLHGWLADVRRLPGVTDLALVRLSYDETDEQVRMLLQREPWPGLVADVLARSRGNPYLSELLVRALEPGAHAIGDDVPEALRSALLAAWHRLSSRARGVLRVVAVAGRPAAPHLVVRVAAAAGIATDGVTAALHEATDAGVVRIQSNGDVWFRHPLLAEVLYGTLLATDAAEVHRAFVDELRDGPGSGPGSGSGARGLEVRRLSDLALHLERAGMPDEAFAHCLRAADAAVAVKAFPEEARLRLRAARIWPRISAATRRDHPSLCGLLADAAQAMRRAGDAQTAFGVCAEARELLDQERDPLTTTRVLVLWAQLAANSGRQANPPSDVLAEAVALSAPFPGSVQHAQALAHLAEAELSMGDPGAGRRHAEAAVAAARASGDKAVLAYALGASMAAHLGEHRATEDADAAYQAAVESGSPEAVALASIQRATLLDDRGQLADCAAVLEHAVDLTSSAGLTGLTRLSAGYAGTLMLELGRFEQARSILRHGLSSRPTGMAGVVVRTAAMVLAVREGRSAEAETHLRRIRELSPRFEEAIGLYGAGALAEHLVGAGHPAEALEMLGRVIGVHAAGEPKYGDRLLVWAATAAADCAVRARDRHDAAAERAAAAALQAVLAARAGTGPPRFADRDTNPVQRAELALFEAYSGRVDGAADESARWREAVRATREGGLRFAHATSLLRLAESLLVARQERNGAERRREAASSLREAHEVAQTMGAEPLVEAVEGLARLARLSLRQPVVPDRESTSGHMEKLTPREREVLGHLAAGRSYAEIAAALFISEKTVSVHVSNLLRKTGTANRVEAAAYAVRGGVAPPA